MNKLVLLFIFCLVSLDSISQQKDNVVKINIFSPIVRTFNFSYERALNASSSLQLGVAITGTEISDTEFSGLQITPEYRFYLSDTEAPEGVYAAPFLRYANLSIEEKDLGSEADLTSFSGGLVLGKQWLFKEKITLDIFIGPSYGTTSIDVESGDEDDFDLGSFDGFGIRFGVNFGFAF